MWPQRPGADWFLGIGCISVSAGAAAGGFALTATHFSRRRKVSKRLCPWRTALRLGSVFPRYGVHPGASPTVCFAAPPLDVCGCAARRCAPTPRMNTSARPAERGKRSKAKARSKARSRAPHPSPLPEGEGTDRGVWGRYTDVKHRVELRF